MLSKFAPDVDGLIHSEAIEINAVEGCNLTCRACSHTSPVLSPRKVADPESVGRSLSLLARAYRAGHVRILGGEPLLHPELPALIEAVRAAGVADRVRMVTNGVLLGRARPAIWTALDEIYVSIYPGYEPSTVELSRWRRSASEYGVELRLRHYDHFRESYSEIGTTDRHLVRRIYRSCLIAHVWLCHNVVDGVFYKCPQSHFLARTDGVAATARDGIPITGDADFPARLLAYLNSDEPLESCRKCLGAVGQRFPHETVRRKVWREPQARPTEELVDYQFLSILEHDDPTASNSCIANEVEVT